MIRQLRNKKTSLLKFFVIGFIVLMAVGLSIDNTNYNSPTQDTKKLVVNNEEVTPAELALQEARVESYYRSTFKDSFERIKGMIDFKSQAKESLIQQKLVEQQLKKLGFLASKEQVQEEIVAELLGGSFDLAKYQMALSQLGVTEDQLKKMVQTQISQKQLFGLFQNLTFTTDKELEIRYKKDNVQKRFNYVRIPSTEFEQKVDMSKEAELKKFYEDHPDAFRKGDSAKFSYIKFNPKDFEKSVIVSDEDIEDLYEESSRKYQNPREVKLQYIYINKDTDSSSVDSVLGFNQDNKKDEAGKDGKEDSEEEKDKSKQAKSVADSIYQKLLAVEEQKRGEKFFELASLGSLKNGKATFRNEWMAAADVDDDLKQSLSTMTKGGVSKPVLTSDGAYILFLEDDKPATKKPLEEVKELVRAEFITKEIPVYARAEAEKVLGDLENSGQKVDGYKSDLRSSVKVDKFLEEGDIAEGESAALTLEALKLGDGGRDIIEVAGAFYVIQNDEFKKSYVQDYDLVKDQVATLYRTEKAKEMAKEYATKLLQEIAAQRSKSDGATLNFESLVNEKSKELKLKVESTPLSAKSKVKGELFAVNRDQIYALDKNSPLIKEPIENGYVYYLAEFAEAVLPLEEEFLKEKQAYEDKLKTQIIGSIKEGLIQSMKSKADIKDSI